MAEEQKEVKLGRKPRDAKEKNLSRLVAEMYRPENIKEEKEIEVLYSDKKKIMKKTTYMNGVTKSKLVEVVKKGKPRRTAPLKVKE